MSIHNLINSSVAKNILEGIENIANLAKQSRSGDYATNTDIFAGVDQKHEVRFLRNQMKYEEDLKYLMQVPTICRIKAWIEDQDSKNEETKYIYILSSHVSSACLKNVSKLSFGVCSYNAPLGQLASRDIGDEITLNNKCFVL